MVIASLQVATLTILVPYGRVSIIEPSQTSQGLPARPMTFLAAVLKKRVAGGNGTGPVDGTIVSNGENGDEK